MKRWRTVGFVGRPTGDGRVIDGPIIPERGRVPLAVRDEDTVGGFRVTGFVLARVVGDEIQARLPSRHKDATPGMNGKYVDVDGILTLGTCSVKELTVTGPGMSAWVELQ